jgi:GNAT superfamily N-acetyltransferase/predicted nucleic acid-binding protein
MISELRAALPRPPKHPGSGVEIFLRPADVLPFVGLVRSSADRERDALGFLPDAAYEDAGSSGRLFVACRQEHGAPRFLGHLLFGGSFPHLRIHQLHVVPAARKLGVARSLVDSLSTFAEQHGYMDITARVASDLPANTAWERLGFATARTQMGGAARNRTINVRVRQLNTPTLFGYPEGKPVSGLPTLARGKSGYTPVYAIDLNVFFDIVKRRPRAEHASQVIGAALDNVIRVVVAEEFAAELRRSFRPNVPDPIYEFALQLPTIPPPEPSMLLALTTELAGIVFPNRSASGALSVRDNSDLVHLATAIHHSASGFVTAENALVAVADAIETGYGINIIHVEHFAQLLQSTKRRITAIDSRFAGRELRLSELTDSLRADLSSIIERIRFSDALREHLSEHGVRSSHGRSIAVSFGGSLVCAALWSRSTRLDKGFAATIVSDEDQPAIESALDALLLAVSEEAVADGPALIELTIPKAHTITRELALAVGFIEKECVSSGAGCFQRMAIGAAVTEKSWNSVQAQIAGKTGNTFSSTLPGFKSVDTRVSFSSEDGTAHQISIDDLETALSPILLCPNTRKYILVPIRRIFADHLLNTAVQISLLPTDAAALFHERVYYSASRNSKLFTPGAVLIFYESGRGHGRSAAVALARVRETATISKKGVSAAVLRHGVLEPSEIESISKQGAVAATVFDNLIRLHKPVSLRSLRTLGCVDDANLVGARRITGEQFSAIMRKGGAVGH